MHCPSFSWRILGSLLLPLGLFASGSGAWAQKLDIEDQAAPTFTVWDVEHGLSDEIWSTVGFDRQGFVWAGSASELARFDGYRWLRWPIAARSLVKDLVRDQRGVLWALFAREGLARYGGHDWELTHHPTGKFDGIWQTADQRLWLLGEHGLWRLEEDQWLHDSEWPPGLGRALGFAQTTALFGEARQWAGSADGGLWWRSALPDSDPFSWGPWHQFQHPNFDEASFSDLLRVVDQGQEQLWIVTYGAGLMRLDSSGLRVWREASGDLPTEAMYAAATTTNQQGTTSVWIASRAGLIRVRGDRIDVFDRRHGLPSDAVRKIRVQRQRDGMDLLWLATENGMARVPLQESLWQTVSLLGAQENGIFGLLLEEHAAGSERLWVASAMDGLALLEEGQWRYFRQSEGTLPARGVRGLFHLPRSTGVPWKVLSLFDGRLYEIRDDSSFVEIPVPWSKGDQMTANFALARAVGDDWEYWFGTNHEGIYRFSQGTWTSFPIRGTTRPWAVLHFAEQIDSGGRSWLWAAGSEGLARFDGTDWTVVDAPALLPEGGLRHILLREEGTRQTLWLSSNVQGVARVDVTDPLAPAKASGPPPPEPPDPTVYSVLSDSQDRLWVCTNNGVQRLVPRDSGGWEPTVFRRPDGLVHDECNTNAQLVDQHDRYWLGTLGGLSVYEPTAERRPLPTPPGPVHFTSVRLDDREYPVRTGEFVDVPAAVQQVRLSFTLLSGLRERESTYRTQLVGLEEGYGPWTSDPYRSFSALPPGTYDLLVEARDWSGNLSQPIQLTISIRPQWYEQRGLQLFAGLLLVALTVTSFLLYLRQVRRRQLELEQEVEARTTELRELNQQLTELTYLDPLTGVANRRRLLEAMELAIQDAIRKQTSIGLLVVDVDHFKEYNDRFGHLVGDVALRAVAQALAGCCREQDLVARFGGEEFACLVVDGQPERVAMLAERMRTHVASLPPRALGNDERSLTISLGTVAIVPEPGTQAGDLLGQADEALYAAKSAGRNCIRHAAG